MALLHQPIYLKYFRLYSDGVIPVWFLKTRLKDVLLLNPDSYAIANILYLP